jgi:uncharacterized protein
VNPDVRADTVAVPLDTAATTPAPVDPSARVTLLDALRGFALFGVCLGNIATAFSFWGAPGTEALAPRHVLPTDGTAQFLYHALVDGKFYSIFSLLFGLGFALQLGRRTDEVTALSTYRRRLWILAGIGFVHLLVWFGDILLLYALLGMVLVRLRGLDDRRLLRWVVILLALPILNYLPLMLHPALTLGMPFYAASYGVSLVVGVNIDAPDVVVQQLILGGWREYLQVSPVGVFFRYGDLAYTGREFKVLAMFLLGMLIGRRRMWEQLEAHVGLLKRICTWGFLVGLPACLLLALDSAVIGDAGSAPAGLQGLGDAVLYALGVAPLALAYAAGFVLLWRIPGWRRRLEWLAPTGRMALTNYLTQTLIAIAVFYGVGLGLGGRVGPTWFLPMALAILVGQTLFSQWWLARHRFGPMEGLWRRWTYR